MSVKTDIKAIHEETIKARKLLRSGTPEWHANERIHDLANRIAENVNKPNWPVTEFGRY